MIAAYILVCFLIATCAFSIADDTATEILRRKSIGFGIDRLKQSNKRAPQLAATDCGNSKEYYYSDAVIDNFAPIQSQQKWKGSGQRYWINDELFGKLPDSPIFVYIGGEAEESCRANQPGLYWYDLAKAHQALLVTVEHRFYGESYPTEGMSTDELRFLSSDQALADLARLISHLKESLGLQKSPVISFGGSYPGNLAAWFRLKYPSVTHGSVASSAPLIAETNFVEYMEVVADSIKYFSGQSCYTAFEEAAQEVTRFGSFGVGSTEYSKLAKDFRTCGRITSEKDFSILLSNLMGNVQGTVQYNNEVSYYLNVSDICATMTSTDPTVGATAYDRFVTLNTQFLKMYGQVCDDVSWNATIAYLKATAKDPSNNGRPWTYQTCNEFGYYQTTDSTKQPFHSWSSLSLDFYRDMCFEGFDGWTSDPQTTFTNEKYGGISIDATNVIFPSGTVDPWHALSVTNSTGVLPEATEQPDFILGTAHCKDMYSPKPDDPAELTYARQQIAAAVASWLAKK